MSNRHDVGGPFGIGLCVYLFPPLLRDPFFLPPFSFQANGGIWKFQYPPPPASASGGGGRIAVEPDTLANSVATYTTVIDPQGNTTFTAVNAAGFEVIRRDALGQQTTLTRDSNNQIVATIDPLGRKSSFTYDAVGNVTTITDPQGSITRVEYEPVFYRLTKLTDALGNITTFEYDERGNLIKTTDPLGNITSRFNLFVHDPFVSRLPLPEG